jgi:hypothetical protein
MVAAPSFDQVLPQAEQTVVTLGAHVLDVQVRPVEAIPRGRARRWWTRSASARPGRRPARP